MAKRLGSKIPGLPVGRIGRNHGKKARQGDSPKNMSAKARGKKREKPSGSLVNTARKGKSLEVDDTNSPSFKPKNFPS